MSHAHPANGPSMQTSQHGLRRPSLKRMAIEDLRWEMSALGNLGSEGQMAADWLRKHRSAYLKVK